MHVFLEQLDTPLEKTVKEDQDDPRIAIAYFGPPVTDDRHYCLNILNCVMGSGKSFSTGGPGKVDASVCGFESSSSSFCTGGPGWMLSGFFFVLHGPPWHVDSCVRFCVVVFVLHLRSRQAGCLYVVVLCLQSNVFQDILFKDLEIVKIDFIIIFKLLILLFLII